MTPETQQKIVKVVDKFFAELGNALGQPDFGYEQGLRFAQEFIRRHGNKTLSALLLEFTGKLISGGPDGSLVPENLERYIAAMDSKQKAEAVLLSIPEPDDPSLDLTLEALTRLLPNLRTALVPFAKRLPPPPGGRPKKLADPDQRRRIRAEIGTLLANGVSLSNAQKRLAARENVGLSTIQRIWRERKNSSSSSGDAVLP